MSTYYDIFAEVNVNGKWYGINPKMLKPNGMIKVRPIYWAQSVFWDCHCDLQDEAVARGVPDDWSEEMKKLFPENLDDKCEYGLDSMTWREYYRNYLYAVNFDKSIATKIKKTRPYHYQGYAYKPQIADYECGADSIVSWLTIDEYRELPDEEKREYAYYEWNNYGDEYGIYYEIYSKITALLDWFGEGDAFGEDSRYSADSISFSQVRVWVYVS